jgi:membrane-associated phospholipid phosphatase
MATVAQMRAVLRGAWTAFRATRVLAFIGIGVAVGLACMSWPHDRAWLDALHACSWYDHRAAHDLAWYLGTWGDYPTYNLPFALALWLIGVATGSRAWRRLAVVAFLGATLAGIFDDCFRLTLGRPRPEMHLSDGFYGPAYAFKGGFQSFPSGHAASTMGMAVALWFCEWRLGALTFLISLGVIWGRMELDKHYPSDVIVGALVGLYFGVLAGRGARRLRPRLGHK